MPPPTHLRHLHLPGLTPYTHPVKIQTHLLSLHLSSLSSSPKLLHPAPSGPPPPPTLLTFETPPTYTCGRREISRLTPSQITHLRANDKAEFHESLRGGQTTFHGPGQLTAFLILNLKTHGFTSRSYVQFLETSIIAVLEHYGIVGTRTENPGVWTVGDEGRKIASVGVHLRRYITGFGVGLNVGTELGWFERIVMCGLPGKRATSFEEEGVKGKSVEEVGSVFAGVLAEGLEGREGEVRRVTEEEVIGNG
ncbi:MAG: hypothetical protein L6R42_000448 [Xanthoria sp. 1 TBL-2021]|nr:MAG: hypothetical protein L6R42_000448 [Xanthoria sp. 1 TBL-2021]